jgi:hypothetical protein
LSPQPIDVANAFALGSEPTLLGEIVARARDTDAVAIRIAVTDSGRVFKGVV